MVSGVDMRASVIGGAIAPKEIEKPSRYRGIKTTP